MFLWPPSGKCLIWPASRHSPLKKKKVLHSSRRHAGFICHMNRSVTIVSTQVEAFSHCLFCQPWLQWPCFCDCLVGIDWLSDVLMADIKTDKRNYTLVLQNVTFSGNWTRGKCQFGVFKRIIYSNELLLLWLLKGRSKKHTKKVQIKQTHWEHFQIF